MEPEIDLRRLKETVDRHEDMLASLRETVIRHNHGNVSRRVETLEKIIKRLKSFLDSTREIGGM